MLPSPNTSDEQKNQHSENNQDSSMSTQSISTKQIANSFAAIKDSEFKSIDDVKVATESTYKIGDVWNKDDLITHVRNFAAANFFSVSLYKGQGIGCTRRSNSHSDKVKSGMHTLTKRSYLIVTDCEWRIEYSRKGDTVTIKKVVAMHNHDCDVHSAARSSKLSGKSTENAINATYPVLAPLLYSGKPIPYQVIRFTIEPHVALGVTLNADTIYSIVRGVRDRMANENYKVPAVISNNDISHFTSQDILADNCREILKDVIQNTNGDTSSLMHRLMSQFRETDPSNFDYRMNYNDNGLITCLTWQTGAMRAACLLYGDIIFQDARKSKNMNVDRVRYQSLVVIGSNGNVLPLI
jgi:YD repeat-containing protein